MTTITDTNPPTDPSSPPASSDRRWRLVAVVAAVVAVASLAVVAVAVSDEDTNPSSRDIAMTQGLGRACQTWLDQSPDAATSTGWCGHMTDWMYEQMASGRMTGSAMWRNPDAMRTTCVQAMTSYGQAADDAQTSCRSMVGWMRNQTGGWSGWMMNPGMMGR